MPRLLKKDWIIAYAEAVDPISEAPRQYNIWSAISVIGAVLKKQVFLTSGQYCVYPNQYVILIGPPGVGKGTAIQGAYEFPEELGLVNTIEDRTNAEKIVKVLAEGKPGKPTIIGGALSLATDSSAVLKALELSNLLGASTWMLDLLCACWDQGKFTYDTKNSGTAVIQNMCVSLIGGCVPDFIRNMNRDRNATVSSGFTARNVFVYAEEQSKRLTWPKPLVDIPGGKEIRKKLLDDLMHISTLTGQFTATPDAMQEFDKWYQNARAEAKDSEVTQYFKARMRVHILKLAMIYSAASNDSLIINRTNMIMAIITLKDIQKSLDKAFRGVGDSELAESMARIQAFMEKAISATRTQIFIHVCKQMTQMTMDFSLDNLIMIRFMDMLVVGTEKTYTIKMSTKGGKAMPINVQGGQP